MVASAVVRCRMSRCRSQALRIARTSAASAASVPALATALRSVSARVPMSRAGVAAKKQTRVRTVSASDWTAPVRTSNQPTPMTTAKTAKLPMTSPTAPPQSSDSEPAASSASKVRHTEFMQ